MINDPDIEKQRMNVLLHDSERFKKVLTTWTDEHWSLEVNKFIFNTAKSHYALHGNIPSIDIFVDYAASKSKGMPEHIVDNMNTVIHQMKEYKTLSTPDDLEHFKQSMDDEALSTARKQLMLKVIDDIKAGVPNAWDKFLEASSAVGRDYRSDKPRRIYSLNKIKEQRGSMEDVLLGDGLLCRREGMVIAASSGKGKSILVTQLAVAWAQGKEAIGIKPQKPLRVLIIQCEDGQKKVEQMVDSIFARLGDPGDDAVIQVDESYESSDEMFSTLDGDMTKYKPDIVIINTFFGFFDGDMNNNKDTNKWLKGGFTRLLQKHGCGGVVVHHLTKSGEKYYGSQVIHGWARAFINLEEVNESEHKFKMTVEKRNYEFGGKSLMLQWSKNNEMYWNVIDNESVDDATANNVLSLFKTADDTKTTTQLFEDYKFTFGPLAKTKTQVVYATNNLVESGLLISEKGKNGNNQPTIVYSLR